MQEMFRIIPSFPQFAARWKTAQFTETKATKIITPNMFITSEDESLLQEAIQELTEEILANNLVRTSGTCPCINLSLRRQRNFAEEFRRMYITLKNNAGFCNDFKGIVAVDLTDWASGVADDDLDAVLSYLKDTEQDRYYIFYAVTEYPSKLKSLLQYYFTIEMHQLHLEKASDLLQFAVSKLKTEYDIELDGKAEVGLMQLIKAYIGTENYRGVGSINSMCRDMAFMLMAQGRRTMDAKFLSQYKQNIGNKESKKEKPAIGLIK